MPFFSIMLQKAKATSASLQATTVKASAVLSGRLSLQGHQDIAQLGDGTRFDRATSVQVSLPPQKFVAIATPREAHSDGSFALSEGGECWTCKLRLHTLCLLVTFTRH